MKELRIGVIGVGGRGSLARHAEAVRPNVRLVAGADPDPQALDAFKARHGNDVFVTDDHRQLLARSDVHAVFVTSPDFCHEEQAVQALEAGKAVYLEKPIAITVAGADRILTAARDTGSKLYLGHNMRYFPAVLKMKEIIDSGLIGPVQAVWCRHFVGIGGDAYFKDWHSERKNSTGLLLQKGAHDIDVIHWLSGSYTQTVVSMGKLSVYDKATRRAGEEGHRTHITSENWPPLSQTDYAPVIDVEDHNMVLMQLENGIQASYVQCHYTPDYWRNYTFIGTKGRIENFGDSGVCQIHVYTTRGGYMPVPDVVHHLKPVSGSHGGSDPAIVGSFIDFVRDGTVPNTSPVAARYAVAAGVAATQSLRSGNAPQDVPTLAPALVDYFDRGQRQT
jgi:predicted dehydrogenase